MEGIIKSVPVRFVKFPSGIECEVRDVVEVLYNMENKKCTTFNLRTGLDKDVYEWIKSIQTGEIREEYFFATHNSIRIYWNENSNMINKMVTEITKLFPDS